MLAVKQATTTIPIVIAGAGDLVGRGIVASLARPGGNITGLENNRGPQLDAKRLELLKEAAPHISRVATLVNPANPGQARIPGDFEAEASALSLQLRRVEASHPDALEGAFAAMARSGADSRWRPCQ